MEHTWIHADANTQAEETHTESTDTSPAITRIKAALWLFFSLACFYRKRRNAQPKPQANIPTHTPTCMFAKKRDAKASLVASSRPVCVPVLPNDRPLTADRNSLSWQTELRLLPFISMPPRARDILLFSFIMSPSSSFLPLAPSRSPSTPVHSFRSLFICLHKPNLFSLPDAS